MARSGGSGSPLGRLFRYLQRGINALGLRHERLDTLYFVLAGLNIATLGAVLWLNHATLTAFREGVNNSSVWSDRQNHLTELSRRARAVDTPPNDIFESHDAPRERVRLAEASEGFRQQLAAMYRHLGAHRLSARDAEVLDELEAASEIITALERISRRTLDDFERGQETQASRDMVLADRTFRELMGHLESAARILEDGRREDLAREFASARRMQVLEFAFGACAILMIGFVLAAGVQVAAVVRENSERQRRMLRELGETRDRLRQYADDVSHELRVPISRMRLDAELLLSQPRSVEAYHGGIETIIEQCNELTSMTEALLFIARAENTSVAVKGEWLDVGRELSLLADYYTAPAEQAGIELTLVNAVGTMWADRALLQRSVSNLIRNALAHAPRGSRVWIAAQGDADSAWIEVRDNGPGLSDALLPRVFDRFQRGRDSEGGAGLGLAIVKSIMDLHGGKISLVTDNGLIARLEFPAPHNGLPDSEKIAGDTRSRATQLN
ncbi:MAG: ATP-binding protein [Terricaulis sp.]